MQETYEEMLAREKASVLANLGIKFDTLAQCGRVGEEDQAQISHEEFISIRLNHLDYQKLKLVNEALLRLREGEYGICRHCEEPIPPRRLQILPWAKYCVPCQEHMSILAAEETVAEAPGSLVEQQL
ncbi:MAG: TraR/DksA family transcriptional regulator [Bryobacteraceae bacterium]